MFSFSAEQEELRTSVRKFLTQQSSSESVRAQIDSAAGYDDDVWRQPSDQMGLPSLAIPEEYGGAGFGPVELGIVLEEAGRALLCSPYFATVALAGQALTGCGDQAAKGRYAIGIAAGGPADELPSAAALAKAYCSEAYMHAAKENIQVHGGIGFTWEHDAHLYLRRAKSSELLFGSSASHRQRLADLVGI